MLEVVDVPFHSDLATDIILTSLSPSYVGFVMDLDCGTHILARNGQKINVLNTT
jgi:hypothetical protein